ncbi:MAG: hydrogenase nickel incorporation protein HypB [Bacillota bacterium]
MNKLKVVMGQRLLRANDEAARENRERFAKSGVFVVNLISSPGTGKTTLLEQTIRRMRDACKIGVIEGDIYTTRDARRIADQGVEVVQINTAGVCHLDAPMIARSLEELEGDGYDLLFIENVGNLVCPAEFDLGEDAKVALLSVTEGGDKPEKYPLVFQEAQAVVVTKSDLLPYTDFDLESVGQELSAISPGIKIMVVSAKTGEGIKEWCRWLEERALQKRAGKFATG